MTLGVEAALWTETVDTRAGLDYLAFPRLLGIAEIAWSPGGRAPRHRHPARQRRGRRGGLRFGRFRRFGLGQAYGDRVACLQPAAGIGNAGHVDGHGGLADQRVLLRVHLGRWARWISFFADAFNARYNYDTAA